MYNQFDISLHPKEYFPDLANEVKQHRSLLNELNEIKVFLNLILWVPGVSWVGKMSRFGSERQNFFEYGWA